LLKLKTGNFRDYYYPEAAKTSRLIVGMGAAAVDPLCKILSHAKESRQQVTMFRAVELLGRLHDRRTIGEILKVADNSDSDFVTDQSPGSGNVIYLSRRRTHPVTAAAAKALGEIGDKEAVPKLVELLDPDRGTSEVLSACCTALGRIGDDRAIEPIKRLLENRNARLEDDACDALACLGPKSTNVLIALLQTPRETGDDTREDRLAHACVALAKIGGPNASPALCAVMQDRQRSRSLRIAAVKALGTLHDQQAVPALVAALKDSDAQMRRASAEALDALGWKP